MTEHFQWRKMYELKTVLAMADPENKLPIWLSSLSLVKSKYIRETSIIYLSYRHESSHLDMAEVDTVMANCMEARYRLEGKCLTGAAEEWADFSLSQLKGALNKFYPEPIPPPNPTLHNDQEQGKSKAD